MPSNDTMTEIVLENPSNTLFDAPLAVEDQDLEGCIGVVGMPTDWTHSSRIGARLGPEALRRATTRIMKEYVPATGDAFHDALHGGSWRRNPDQWIVDLGDAKIDPGSVEKTTAAIAEMTEHVRHQGGVPLALGGDHYNSYPACLGYSRALTKIDPDRRFGYIQIDGHLDFSDRLGAWGHFNHATNGRRVSELPNIVRENMVWIGVTGWVSGGELNLIEEMGGKVYSSGDVHRLGARKVAELAIEQATRGCDSLYLSMDIDAMDAGYLPGTGSIVHSGITPKQYCDILDVIAKHPIDGMDIAEVAPTLDPSGRTEAISAHLLYSVVREQLLVSA
jgi:arginase family enzyme